MVRLFALAYLDILEVLLHVGQNALSTLTVHKMRPVAIRNAEILVSELVESAQNVL